MPDPTRSPEYDPPPAPPGVSPDARYLGECYAHGTRAILRAVGREPSPRRSWLATQFVRLPVEVRTSIAMGVLYLALQFGGAAYESLTGHAPPQVTVPTMITAPIPSAGAATGEP